MREQDDIANGVRIRQQHCEPVDADSFACGRRQSIAEGTQILPVELLRDFIAATLHLRQEAAQYRKLSLAELMNIVR